jgi:hypothetical protein
MYGMSAVPATGIEYIVAPQDSRIACWHPVDAGVIVQCISCCVMLAGSASDCRVKLG